MIRSLRELFGYNIRGSDGEIGSVHDFYFDDHEWTVRYIVVDTGKWLPGRKVLLSPSVARNPNWANHALPVELTRKQVENSPPIDAHKTVDRQYEETLSEYYGWPVYWMQYPAVPAMAVSAPPVRRGLGGEAGPEDIQGRGDPHLRSVREVTDYFIHATDGEIGHAADFVAETQDWRIRYLVVSTRNWLPGRKVLVAPEWVSAVDWSRRQINVSLSRSQVENSPKFDATDAVNREYEEQLYDYYGRPKYW